MTTVMDIECCKCKAHMGQKDGHGKTGTTSTICEPCAMQLLPVELHADYLRRKELGVGE